MERLSEPEGRRLGMGRGTLARAMIVFTWRSSQRDSTVPGVGRSCPGLSPNWTYLHTSRYTKYALPPMLCSSSS